MVTKVPSLINPLVKAFIEDKEFIFSLVDAFGSPLNIVFPDVFAENIKPFKQVLEHHNINYQFSYCSKPNKSWGCTR